MFNAPISLLVPLLSLAAPQVREGMETLAVAAQVAPPATRPASPRGQPAPPAVPRTIADRDDPDGFKDSRLEIARRLLRENHFAEAEMVSRTVLNEHPRSDRAAAYLGLALHKQKRYGQAREFLERAALSKVEFPEREHMAHFLGWCCYYMGDAPAARHYFEIHASNWPNFDDTHYGLGVIALDEDRIDDAEQSFDTALRLQQAQDGDKRSVGKTLARLGDVALRRGRDEEALRRYEKAVELWPDHYEAWARLVRLYYRADRIADAERAELMLTAAKARMGRLDPPEQGSESTTAPESAPAPSGAPDSLPAPSSTPAPTPPITR